MGISARHRGVKVLEEIELVLVNGMENGLEEGDGVPRRSRFGVNLLAGKGKGKESELVQNLHKNDEGDDQIVIMICNAIDSKEKYRK